MIPEITEKILHKTYNSNLRTFFNYDIMSRWREILKFKKYTYENYIKIVGQSGNLDIYKKYLVMWGLFQGCVDKVKIITDKYIDLYKDINHTIPGCTNISKKLYLFSIKLNTGFDINKITIAKLFKWGVKEYKKIRNLTSQVIIKIHPELANKSYHEQINFMTTSKLYKHKSKEDFIKHHFDELDKIKKTNKLPLLKDAKIVDFDDENMAGGYWFRDAFYLNTYNWKEIESFSTKALILHETIPGHHLQLSYETHSGKTPTLMGCWYPTILNGNAEGWALFAEKLAPNYTYLELLGVLTYNMLRTLRIIADISIHYIGIEPSKVINMFKKNLIMNESNIKSEVYRYVCLPGQALCYKMGDNVIRHIVEKNIVCHDAMTYDYSFK